MPPTASPLTVQCPALAPPCGPMTARVQRPSSPGLCQIDGEPWSRERRACGGAPRIPAIHTPLPSAVRVRVHRLNTASGNWMLAK